MSGLALLYQRRRDMEPHCSEVLQVLLRLTLARRTLPVPLFWEQLHDFKIHNMQVGSSLMILKFTICKRRPCTDFQVCQWPGGPGVAAAGSVSAATECHSGDLPSAQKLGICGEGPGRQLPVFIEEAPTEAVGPLLTGMHASVPRRAKSGLGSAKSFQGA